MFPKTLARIIFRKPFFVLRSLYFDFYPRLKGHRGKASEVQSTKYYVVTCRSESTIATIVQSVGVSSRLKGKLASLPRHQKTNSPTPAPAASTATIGLPCGAKSLLSDWTTSSLRPLSESFFTVATTVPITRASCIDFLTERSRNRCF